MARNSARTQSVKSLEEAAQATFFDMFRKESFYKTLSSLSLEPMPRVDFFRDLLQEGSMMEYYRIEYYLIAHKLIEFSIDPHISVIKIRLTEKGLALRDMIDEIETILKDNN